MKGMFLKLKNGNRKSEMGNMGGVPIFLFSINFVMGTDIKQVDNVIV
jgi:hypothetical protein